MFLALLLVRGIPAVFKDCQVDEVSFQTRHLGWETDDFLVSCSTERDEQRLLAIQARRKFAVRSSSSDCVKTFQRFWKDFTNAELFDPDHDMLVLATLPGTEILMDGFGSLLECARNSSDEEDFHLRLTTPRFISAKAKNQADVIKSVLDAIDSSHSITDNDFWRFLRSIHLFICDFTTSVAQQESWVKTMLAQAATGVDSVEAAATTWFELISIAAVSAPRARIVKRSDLPKPMRSKYRTTESPASALQALTEHSDVTMQGIRATIAGTVNLPRNRIVTRGNEALAETRVVAITGPAGSGKSAVAKAVVQWQAKDFVCFSFRAEEFAESRIDRVFQGRPTGRQLETLLAAQERAVLHVESLERLLEHPTRDAFSDLIRIVERCHNVRLLLTCRDYSLATALTSFFGQSTLSREVVEVLPLDDQELKEIANSLPQLANPLSNPSLKQLLRIPYFLDMAARMDWTGEQVMPSDVRAFRRRCWSEVVRRDALTTGGLPDKRERALVDLAVRRARELRPSVSIDGIDAEALDALYKDGIISKDAHGLAAPAHDVIEDWAIVHWIETLAAKYDWQAFSIADSVGGHPALRRGFREWLKEALEKDIDRADKFVLSAYGDSSLAQHFRDDVLTSVLLSRSARDFVSRQRDQLLADDAALLVRLVHLTRVACKTVPRWLDDQNSSPSVLLEPAGEAWPAVLQAVADGLDELLPSHTGAVVGLLEDWARGANWFSPLPNGGAAAGKIAFTLLEGSSNYWNDDLRKRLLKIIARVPRAYEKGFKELVGRTLDRASRNDSLPRDFAEILLYGIDGVYASRDFPEQVARLTLSWCCLTGDDLQSMVDAYWNFPDIEPEFGLRSNLNMAFFPASAIRGPFLTLLRSHPAVGVQLVLDLMNHAGHWYGKRKWQATQLETANPITISVPGHGEVTQWSNDRLWAAYRGTSVTPHVLECALMALEYWLLELCEGTDVIEPWLLKILLESNSVMTTAVVASVCNAHPERSGGAALALLTSRQSIEMDRARTVKELSTTPLMDLPGPDPMQRIYEDERKRSNAMGHRRQDLEVLAWKLQLAGKSEQVWAIIDSHRAQIPDECERTDEDMAWLLALHRMDARNYEAEVARTSPKGGVSRHEVEESRTISFKNKGIDADLQEFVDTGARERQQFLTATSLMGWAYQHWEMHADGGDIDSWRTVLIQAVETQKEETAVYPVGLTSSGPSIVAAVCVRDHWEDMDADDRQWCVDTLIAEIERHDHSDHRSPSMPNDPMSAARHGAYVLPKFLAHDPEDAKILNVFAKALTHQTSQVSLWAAEGAGEYLVSERNELAVQCVGAVAMQANLLQKYQKQRDHDRKQPFSIDSPAFQRVQVRVRDAFAAGNINAEKELAALDLTSWHGRNLVVRVLAILGKMPDMALSKCFFTRAAWAVIASWTAKRRKWDGGRDFGFERDLMRMLASVALTLPSDEALVCYRPFLDAVDEHHDEVGVFVELLITQEDLSSSKESCFWDIWKSFAVRIIGAPWLPSIDRDYSRSTDLIDKMLFRMHWNEGTRRWHRLGGHEQEVDDFMIRLPAAAPVLLAYCHYLYKIGEGALPRAFIVLANRLEVGNAAVLLSDGNTMFYLESLLQRYVYGQPLRLKSDPNLLKAVLAILDQLVEAGSSSAYRMRDDFVTPMSYS